jgi:hypothetical protein
MMGELKAPVDRRFGILFINDDDLRMVCNQLMISGVSTA